MESGALREGMTVYSKDGKKLGKIVELDDDTLVVEKGLFFRKDHVADVADVDRVHEGEVWLRSSAADIEAAARHLYDDDAVTHDDDDDDDDTIVEDRTVSPAVNAATGEPRSAQTLYEDPGDDDVVVTLDEEDEDVISVTPEPPLPAGTRAPRR
jgi:hypothetical protein